MADLGIDAAFTLAVVSVGMVGMAVYEGDRNWIHAGAWVYFAFWFGLAAAVVFFLAVVFGG